MSLICCSYISSFFPACVPKLPRPYTKKEPYMLQLYFKLLFCLCAKTSLLLRKEGALYVAATFQASFLLVLQNFLSLTHKEGALYVAATFQAFF
jgi:hypothetical protein